MAGDINGPHGIGEKSAASPARASHIIKTNLKAVS